VNLLNGDSNIMHIAAVKKPPVSLKVWEMLLESHADLNKVNAFGESPLGLYLTATTTRADKKVISSFLERGFDHTLLNED